MIGEVPRHWDIIKFKYVFNIIGGNGFPEILQGNEEGNFRFAK